MKRERHETFTGHQHFRGHGARLVARPGNGADAAAAASMQNLLSEESPVVARPLLSAAPPFEPEEWVRVRELGAGSFGSVWLGQSFLTGGIGHPGWTR